MKLRFRLNILTVFLYEKKGIQRVKPPKPDEGAGVSASERVMIDGICDVHLLGWRRIQGSVLAGSVFVLHLFSRIFLFGCWGMGSVGRSSGCGVSFCSVSYGGSMAFIIFGLKKGHDGNTNWDGALKGTRMERCIPG